jgi:hypothetical protein
MLDISVNFGCRNEILKLKICYFGDMHLVIASLANYANLFSPSFVGGIGNIYSNWVSKSS